MEYTLMHNDFIEFIQTLKASQSIDCQCQTDLVPNKRKPQKPKTTASQHWITKTDVSCEERQ